MRFHLIDRIDGWDVGKSLRAKKFLALGEEYLADHFPSFPVMPGVLMLQAVVEAASWLLLPRIDAFGFEARQILLIATQQGWQIKRG